MIRCLCCTRVGEPAVRAGVEVRDNLYDRAPTPVAVESQVCAFCNSDLVVDVAACRACGQQPAECDDDCISCTVQAIRTMPQEFEFAAAFWQQPGWREAAERAGRVTA